MIRPVIDTQSTPSRHSTDDHPRHIAPVLNDRIEAIESTIRKQIFFVVGSPKSGTTWVQNLLDAHPHIACRGETHFAPFLQPIEQIVQVFNQQKRGESMPSLDDHDAVYLFANMFALILSKWGAGDEIACVGEKSPQHAAYAELLASVFPQSRFVHIVRDPRDVAISGWYHNLRKNTSEFCKQYPNLTTYSRFIIDSIWPAHVNGARKVREIDPRRYFEVRYEDLLAEPENIVSEMLRFLGTDDAPEHVQQCLHASSFERNTNGRSRGEEDLGSFYRKGVAGDWKNHLTDEQNAMFIEKLAGVMSELGYETE